VVGKATFYLEIGHDDADYNLCDEDAQQILKMPKDGLLIRIGASSRFVDAIRLSITEPPCERRRRLTNLVATFFIRHIVRVGVWRPKQTQSACCT
jgi:hypothetical protein